MEEQDTTLGKSNISINRDAPIVGQAIELTTRFATSWLGLCTGYITTIVAAAVGFHKFQDALKGTPPWEQIAILALPILTVLALETIPAIRDQLKKRHLTEISGNLQAGYFRLTTRGDELSFMRADGAQCEILRWLDQPAAQVLYLTGASGSGKSSLLAAWVIPKLERKGRLVIRVRGYQNPLDALEQELKKPSVVWQKPPGSLIEIRSLLEQACGHIRPRRLLVVFDQFEEFVILHGPKEQGQIEHFFALMREHPISGLNFLLVIRSEYVELTEKLALPRLLQEVNWKGVPAFTEVSARDFILGSGLKVSDDLLRDLLGEAAQIEQTPGLIRPITINLCGLVIGRFASGLPRGFRRGGLVRGFLQEALLLPAIRDIAPVLIPELISSYVTKKPRTVQQLAEDIKLKPEVIRGCLRVLGQGDRMIVHPLDEEQETWEISHDFLVPRLDNMIARWKVPWWRRAKSWLPWIVTASLVVIVIVLSTHNPLDELAQLGWTVSSGTNEVKLYYNGTPPKESLASLKRLHSPLTISTERIDNSIAYWSILHNLSSLSIRHTDDLTPLKDLVSLTSLEMNFAPVSDLTPLEHLTKLTTLKVSYDSQLRDLTPLKSLKNLTTLELSQDKQLKDLMPLKDLVSLTTLTVEFSLISDLTPLENLTKLTTLDLSANKQLSGLEPLKSLTKLTTLDLSDDWQLRDLTLLKSLTNLTTLSVANNSQFSDLKLLKSLTNLTSLDLSDILEVTDLTPLENLTKLTTLNLSSASQLTDLTPLKHLTKLTTLNLSNASQLTDLTPLKNLTNLTSLNVSSMHLTDLTPLKGLTNLTTLDLSYNPELTNVTPLKGLTKLTSLYLTEDTQVADITPLKGLKVSIIR